MLRLQQQPKIQRFNERETTQKGCFPQSQHMWQLGAGREGYRRVTGHHQDDAIIFIHCPDKTCHSCSATQKWVTEVELLAWITVTLQLTDGPVQRLARLFVPHQRGLSLIGHAHRWDKSNISIDKSPPFKDTVVNRECLIRTWLTGGRVADL